MKKCLLVALSAVLVAVSIRGAGIRGATAPALAGTPPANDDFENAAIVAEVPFTDELNTSNATTAANDPLLSCKSASGYGRSVWYRYSPVQQQAVILESSGFDTVLAVFTGSKDALNEEACDDDDGSDSGSRIKVKLEEGETYYILVGAWGGTGGGDLTFTVTEPADLTIEKVSVSPSNPLLGEEVDVTVTVRNQGTTDAGPFIVDVYQDLQDPPIPNQIGDAFCMLTGLAVGATDQCARTVTYDTAGSFDLWVQVDTDQEVHESNDDNNVSGPHKVNVNAPGPTPTASPSPTPTATPPPKDPDGDTDGDGCPDAKENGLDEVAGGLRSYYYFWDWYDQWTSPPEWTRDGTVVAADISAVVFRFGSVRTTPRPDKAGLAAEALTVPMSLTGYHTGGDRSAPVGPNQWNAGPPDDTIVANDISLIVAQFGHVCG